MSSAALIDRYQQEPEFAQQVNERMNALLTRSTTDPAFRQQLLTTPRAAIAEFKGEEYTGTTNFVFVESKADITVVLPDFIDPAAELAEDDLASVAGGCTPTIIFIAATVIELMA